MDGASWDKNEKGVPQPFRRLRCKTDMDLYYCHYRTCPLLLLLQRQQHRAGGSKCTTRTFRRWQCLFYVLFLLEYYFYYVLLPVSSTIIPLACNCRGQHRYVVQDCSRGKAGCASDNSYYHSASSL